MIEKLLKSTQPGVFNGFAWPSTLPAFSDFNLIYGWNYSGKTTLSNHFRYLELKTTPESGDFRFSINGANMDSASLPTNATLPKIKVFNRPFIDENVFSESGTVTPIYYLGKQSIEQQKQLQKVKDDLAAHNKELPFKSKQKEAAEKALGKFLTDGAKPIKDLLSSGGDPSAYNNYDRSNFKKTLDAMCQDTNPQAYELDETKKQALKKQISETIKDKLSPASLDYGDPEALKKELIVLLTTKVTSKAIESLASDNELSTWVETGFDLHKVRTAMDCLYCGQSLPKERIDQLEAHFDTSFKDLMNKLDSYMGKVQGLNAVAKAIQLPKKAELYANLANEFEIAEKAFNEDVKHYIQFLDVLEQTAQKKKAAPFTDIPLTAAEYQAGRKHFDSLNDVIAKHNKTTDDFNSEVDNARSTYEKGLVFEKLSDYKQKQSEASVANQAHSTLSSTIATEKEQIAVLEQQLSQHGKAADELNNDLRSYLGHDELKLEVKDAGYTLVRGGVPAVSLSEGEKTAVAFLYFLRSLSDKDFDPASGVVVIDDPVSSLDSNSLYSAFGFMREKTKDVGQLFVLTHNLLFFRQVRNWFSFQKKGKVSYYMLEVVNTNSARTSRITGLDPLLKDYNSEYHYLFSLVYKASQSVEHVCNLTQSYYLPNVARRMLEAFLEFKVPGKGNLHARLEKIDFDPVKKAQIERFCETHSHSRVIDDTEQDQSVLSEAKIVAKNIMELILGNDKTHYEEMATLMAE